MLVFLNFVFWGFWGGPGGFKKLREACRKNFHLVAPFKTSMVPSYDQKPWGGFFSSVIGICIPGGHQDLLPGFWTVVGYVVRVVLGFKMGKN